MKVKNIYKKVLAVLAVFVLFIGILFGNVKTITTKAEDYTYTQDGYSFVMDDLNKDLNFTNKFVAPRNIDVIQIAKGSKGEVYLYVYLPGGGSYELDNVRLGFSTFDMSIEIKDYPITLMSRDESGCFHKYEVIDVYGDINRTENVSYYEVVQLGKYVLDNDEIVGTDVHPISKRWVAFFSGGKIYYEMEKAETIEITDKWVGHLRYSNGFHLCAVKNTDSYFMVFNTNKQMDDLVEADVSYYQNQRTKYTYLYPNALNQNTTVDGTSQAIGPVTLSKEQKGSNTASGLLGHKYEWNRIEKAQTFLENESELLSDEAKDEVQSIIDNNSNMAWVLRVAESQYSIENIIGPHPENNLPTTIGTTTSSTFVSHVSILRLKFVTAGVTYNLGVIDNEVTPDTIPDGGADFEDGAQEEIEDMTEDFNAWLEKTKTDLGLFFDGLGKGINGFFSSFGGIFLLIVLLAIFAPLLPAIVSLFVTIIKGIGKLLLLLFKGVWWLLCFPFNLIIKLFGKKDKK